jgi:hypothetical protein
MRFDSAADQESRRAGCLSAASLAARGTQQRDRRRPAIAPGEAIAALRLTLTGAPSSASTRRGDEDTEQLAAGLPYRRLVAG